MMEEPSPVLINRTAYSNNPKGANSFFRPLVQPKLQINQSNNSFEREADSVAENLGLSSSGQPAAFQSASGVVQMKTTNASRTGVSAPDSVHDVVNSRGQSLDNSTSGFMQSRLGQDFSNVRVHDDSSAHASSEEIGALAYTCQNHIVFGAGQYQPKTNAGQQLIAHELTHVIQQTSSKSSLRPSIMRKEKPNDELQSCNASQQNLIQPAIDDARTAVHRATSVLGSAIGQPKNLSPSHRNLLLRDFHTAGSEDIRTIFRKYNSLGRALDSGIEVACEPVCDKVPGGGVVAGYAYNTQAWGGHGPLHMCFDKQGFDFAAAPQNKRVQLIIHEGSHRFTGTDDKAYASFPANSTYNSLSAGDAMDNADSYALFASSL